MKHGSHTITVDVHTPAQSPSKFPNHSMETRGFSDHWPSTGDDLNGNDGWSQMKSCMGAWRAWRTNPAWKYRSQEVNLKQKEQAKVRKLPGYEIVAELQKKQNMTRSSMEGRKGTVTIYTGINEGITSLRTIRSPSSPAIIKRNQ